MGQESDPSSPDRPDRRSFLSRASSWFMVGGVAAGYGACGAMGARYLFPAQARRTSWQFVARTSDLVAGSSFPFKTPAGESVAIARTAETGGVGDFIALSSTCPHLGCQVHWEGQNDRFFCPCHNGVFSPAGEGISGPPAEAGQSLPRYPLKVEEGLLYIEVPVEYLASTGHDPCLTAGDAESELG